MLSNRIEEIMTREIITAAASDKIADVMQLMATKNVGCVAIADRQAPIGIFTEQDVLKRVMDRRVTPEEMEVERVMTAPVQTVHPDTHILKALGKMYRGKFRHLLVREDGKTPVGLVSMRDILKLAVRLGETLVDTEAVEDIMSADLILVDACRSIKETIETMQRENAGCVIVLSGGKPKGIFTERDVLKRVAIQRLDAETTPVREVMTNGFITAAHCAPIDEVLAEMNRRGFRNMPIRGREGKLVGIVSLANVLQYAKAFDVDGIVRNAWKEVEEFWDAAEHYTPG